MNEHEHDDALDELVALYRQSANETAPRRVDAKVLRAVEAYASRGRVRRAWPWLGLAMAASFAMWLAVYHAMPMQSGPIQSGPMHSAPTFADDPTGFYLLHMDVTPPHVRRDAYASRSDGLRPAMTDTDTLKEIP